MMSNDKNDITKDDSSGTETPDLETIKTEPPDHLSITDDLQQTEKDNTMKEMHQVKTDVSKEMDLKQTVFEVNSLDLCDDKKKQTMTLPLHCQKLNTSGEYRTFLDGETSCESSTDTTQQDGPAEDILFTCEICSKSFEQNIFLKMHVQTHSSDGPYTCDVCNKVYQQSRTFQRHILLNSMKSPSHCSICHQGFHTKSQSENHQKRVHKIQQIEKAAEEVQKYICDICNCFYENLEQLNVHLETHFQKSPSSTKNQPYSSCTTRTRRSSRKTVGKCGETLYQQSQTVNQTTLEQASVEVQNVIVCEENTTGKRKKNEHISLRGGKNTKVLKTALACHKCADCGETFLGEALLRKHLLEHLKKEFKFCCDECGMKFTSEAKLDQHITDKHTKIQCTECDRWLTPECMRHHTKIHKGNGISEKTPFQCDVCEKVFKLSKSLKAHMNVHYPKQTYDCEVCCKKFATGDHLNSHMKTHTQAISLNQSCQSDEVFQKNKEAMNEVPSVGKASEKQKSNASTAEVQMLSNGNICKCDICKRVFSTYNRYRKHTIKCKQKSKTKCQICSKNCGGVSRLRTHIENVHSEQDSGIVCEENTTGKTTSACYKCADCGETFLGEALLRKHLLEHLKKEFKFCCDECGMKFTSEAKLEQHITDKHTKIQCTECDRWLTPECMRHHTKIHKGNGISEKTPFQCDVCEKVFKLSKSLKAHMNVHYPKQTYNCEVCCKKFATGDHLNSHMKTHTQAISLNQSCQSDEVFQKNKEAMNEVPSVGKASEKQKSNASTAEVQMLSNGNICKCDICKRVFSTYNRYRKHTIKCKQKSKTKCQICSKNCGGVSRLRSHMENVHSDHKAQVPVRHQCAECGELLLGETPFRNHLLEHFKKVFIFQCDECEMKFTSESKLQHHTTEKHTTIPCDECGQLFTTKHMRSHTKTHNRHGQFEKNPFQCDVCDMVFVGSRTLARHMDNHYPKQTFGCEVCCRPFTILVHLKDHMKTHPQMQELSLNHTTHIATAEKENKTQLLSSDKKENQQEDIDTALNSRVSASKKHNSALRMASANSRKRKKISSKIRHSSNEHTPGWCAICNRKFTLRTLQNHLQTHRQNVGYSKKNILHCKVCSKVFSAENTLKRHVQLHAPKRELKCEVCGKMFTRHCQITKHLDTHNILTSNATHDQSYHKNQNMYIPPTSDERKTRREANDGCFPKQRGNKTPKNKCQFCGHLFIQRNAFFKSHVKRCKLKKSVKIQTCRKCRKAFQNENLLRNHMLEHMSEIFTFRCDDCARRFSSKSMLDKHITNSHNKAPCSICFCRFSPDVLQLHKDAVHTDANYDTKLCECGVCKELFGSMNSLKAHMVIHTTAHTFDCKVCSKRFVSMRTLRSHQNTHLITYFQSAKNKQTAKSTASHIKDETIGKFRCDKETSVQFKKTSKEPASHTAPVTIDAGRGNNENSTRKKTSAVRKSNNQNSKTDHCSKDRDENERIIAKEGETIGKHVDSCKRAYSKEKGIKGRKRKSPFKICRTTFKGDHKKELSRQEPKHLSTRKKSVSMTKHTCGECGDSFTEKDGIDSHMLKHLSELYTFQCDKCSTRLRTKQALKSHIRSRHTKKPCKDTLAQEKYSKKTRRQRKKDSHEFYYQYCSGTATQNIECPVCKKHYDNTAAHLFNNHLKTHMKWLHVQQTKKQDYVHKRTDENLTIDAEGVEKTIGTTGFGKSHDQEGNALNKCFVIPESTIAKDTTIRQNSVNNSDIRTGKSPKSLGQIQEETGTRKAETSPKGKGRFQPLDNIHNDSTTDRKETQYDPGDLLNTAPKENIDTSHVSEIQVWTVRKYFHCERCNLEFTHEHTWKQHSNICADEMMCDHCGTTFMGKRQLQSHMQRDHRRYVALVCHICGEYCTGKQAFDRHNREKHSAVNRNSKKVKKRHLCEQCGQAFSAGNLLWKHQQTVHLRKGSSCDICGKSFAHEIVMKKHMQSHKAATNCEQKQRKNISALPKPVSGSNACDICGERMMKRSIQKHRQVAHDIMRCGTCGDDFLSDVYLEHRKTHRYTHVEPLWNCHTCGKQFKSKHNLTSHTTIYHTKRTCDLCEFVCESNQQLTCHRIMNHSTEMMCTICNKSFPHEYSLRRHISRDHNTKVIIRCQVCGKTAKSKDAMKRHMKRHGVLPQCPVCAKEFLTDKQIERHIWQIHETSKCDVCGEDFTNGIFKNHKKKCLPNNISKEPAVFECKVCGKHLEGSSALNYHLGKHLIAKESHECMKCGKTFATAMKLTRHENVHMLIECNDCGKKFESRLRACHTKQACLRERERLNRTVDDSTSRVKCDICGKGFKTKGQVQRHMFSHTRALYTCQICKFTTKSKGVFDRHGKTHEPKKKKKYAPGTFKNRPRGHKTCSVCNVKVKSEQMELHMFKHTGIYTYECSICGKKVATRRMFKYHLGSHVQKEERLEAKKKDELVQ